MAQALDGEFIANVSGVSVEAMGANNTPALKVLFKTSKKLVGVRWEPVSESNTVNKVWFLTPTVVKQGKNAGKSVIELCAIDLKNVFDYDGPFDEAEISASLMNKEVKLTCRPKTSDKGTFTDVQWVNRVDGGGSSRTPKKALSPTALAALTSAWKKEPANPLATSDVWGKV